MRLKGATVGTVPRLFISRHQCVVLISLLALCSSVGIGINISGIDLRDHQCAAFEITLPSVCHLSCDLALLLALLLFTVLCSSSDHISHNRIFDVLSGDTTTTPLGVVMSKIPFSRN